MKQKIGFTCACEDGYRLKGNKNCSGKEYAIIYLLYLYVVTVCKTVQMSSAKNGMTNHYHRLEKKPVV